MARFLHTGDWQLGMTRHFLSDDAQARYSEARFEAIRRIGQLAKTEKCEFIVVCGDIFETNQVDRQTVAKACEAMALTSVPIFLLPGNHDPLDVSSVFRSPTFLVRKPTHVYVLDNETPREIRPGLEVLGAPWTSKRPLRDLAGGLAATIEPRSGVVRILAGHGAVDSMSPDASNPALISLASAEQSIQEKRIHYLALGDRHSLTSVGDTRRIWYSGTPVVTDFDEIKPGFVLIVDAEDDSISVTPHQIGQWRFHIDMYDLNNDTDLNAFENALRDFTSKERMVLRLSFRGSLSLKQHVRLQTIVDNAKDVFAALDVRDHKSDLVVLPDAADFADLNLSGFAKNAVERLKTQAASTGDSAVAARDALALLVRLAGSSK